MNTLRDLLEGQFNVKTDLQESVVVVGSTPTRVLGNNPNRLSFIIGNASTTTVNFAHAAGDLTSSVGLPVGGGSSIASEWKTDFDVTGYELWAQSTGGNVSVLVREVVTAGMPAKE